MSTAAFKRGERIGISMSKLRLMIPDNDCYEFLIYCPAQLIPEYEYVPNKNWLRGKFTRVGNDKFLLTGDGRINESPVTSSLCKLFRDENSHNPDGLPRHWVREEFCIKDTERYYDDGDPGRTGWYKVISERVDSSTPPPNDYQNWEKLPG